MIWGNFQVGNKQFDKRFTGTILPKKKKKKKKKRKSYIKTDKNRFKLSNLYYLNEYVNGRCLTSG